MERRKGIGEVFSALPLAHQVVIGVAAVVLGLAAVLFFRWVSTPSYAVLITNLDDSTLSSVVQDLDRQGVPYRLEAGGSRVLVPRADVNRARADLAGAGVSSGSLPQGYEILDGQGLNVSDFRQRIDLQRALEGELSRTLLAMSDITSATVHLVIPEETLFVEDEEPATASVLLDSARPLSEVDVEAVTFLVASSVGGLKAENVTVADVDGEVLHAAGEIASEAATSNRNLRMTRDFETALAADVRRLLGTVVDAARASVVVRAQLDFNEESKETETYDAESAVALSEQTVKETFVGSGTPPGGTLGIEATPIETEDGQAYTYDRDEVTRQYGVDRIVSRSVTTPGKVDRLSVAVVMDDGSLTGAQVPAMSEIEALVSAAVGLDKSRGDTLSVSTVALPVLEVVEIPVDAAVAPVAADPMAMIPQIVAGLVLVVVMIALLRMARGGKPKKEKKGKKGSTPEAIPQTTTIDLTGNGARLPEVAAAGVGNGEGSRALQSEVLSLVEQQPDATAELLRSWLADQP